MYQRSLLHISLDGELCAEQRYLRLVLHSHRVSRRYLLVGWIAVFRCVILTSVK